MKKIKKQKHKHSKFKINVHFGFCMEMYSYYTKNKKIDREHYSCLLKMTLRIIK